MLVSSVSCILTSATKQDNRRSLFYNYDYESRVRQDEPESEYGAPNILAHSYEYDYEYDSDPVSHDPYGGHDTPNHDPYHEHDTANHDPYHGQDTLHQDPYHGHDTANHDPDLNSHSKLFTVDPEPHQYEYFVNHGGMQQHVNNDDGGYIADLKQEEFKPSLKFAHHTTDYKYLSKTNVHPKPVYHYNPKERDYHISKPSSHTFNQNVFVPIYHHSKKSYHHVPESTSYQKVESLHHQPNIKSILHPTYHKPPINLPQIYHKPIINIPQTYQNLP